MDVGPFPVLEALVRFHEPLQVNVLSLPFESNLASNLPRTLSIICWSATRPEINVTAEFANSKGMFEPLVVEKIERIEAKNYAELKEQKVAAAYRIDVKLRGEAKLIDAGRFRHAVGLLCGSASEGKALIDAGPFHRQLVVSLAGSAASAAKIDVQGSILGDVQVIGTTSGRLEFSSFNANRDASQMLTLQSSTPDLELTVDERTAKFLNVDLKKQAGAEPTWQLTVTVKAGEVTGTFPRDAEKYRDSAVYVRPVRKQGEPPTRATRIPVTGSATSE